MQKQSFTRVKWLVSVLILITIGAWGWTRQTPKPDPVYEFKKELMGVWESQNLEFNGSNYLQRKIRINEKDWSIAIEVYGDKVGKQPLFLMEFMGPYKISEPSSKVAGAFNGAFHFSKKFITLFSDDPEIITALGFQNCGLQVDKRTDISKDGCSFIESIADCSVDYDLIRVDGNISRAGKRTADMCHLEGRPTELGFPAIRVLGLENILAPNAELKTIITNRGLQFAEGPVWDKRNDRLIFSDVVTGKIHTWSADKGLSTLKENMTIPTGNKITADGKLIHCSGGARGLMSMDLHGNQQALLIDNINGKKLNSPNDLVIKSDGTIWFTDPNHGLLFTGQAAEVAEKGVYSFDPKTKKIQLVNASLNQPNGIAFSPDETVLYVGVAPTPQEYKANPNGVERSVYAFNLSSNNILSDGKKLIDIGASSWGVDGMKVDSQGNLYLSSGKGVRVYQANGNYLGLIDTKREDIVNMAFGGSDYKTLYILGHQSVHSIDLQVAGL